MHARMGSHGVGTAGVESPSITMTMLSSMWPAHLDGPLNMMSHPVMPAHHGGSFST